MESLIILAVYLLAMVGIGLYSWRKTKNVSDFVLGGRNVGSWLTAFAYGTSYFSAVVFIGYAGQFGWNYGLSATWIGIGNALIGSFLAWLVLGRRTRVMTKHLESATMPDFFGKRYDSKALRVVSSAIIFIFLVPYSASVYKGLGNLFSLAFDIDLNLCLIIMAAITGFYVIAGGYLATAISDFVQGIIMLAGIILVIVSVLSGKGGFTEAVNQLSQISSANGETGAYTSLFGPDPMGLFGVIVLTSLGTWGLPQMIHKFYTIRDDKAIKKGTVISTVFALVISGGSYFMGSFGRLYVEAGENGKPAAGYDMIVPQMLKGNVSDILLGVVVVLVFSASMSTLSSLVMASSSTFTLDFLKGNIVKNMSVKAQMLAIRILCAFFVILSVVIALNPNNLITALMSLSWGALAGSFLAPFLYGLYWKGVTKAAVWASFIAGIGVTGSNYIISLALGKAGGVGFATPPMAGAIAMLVSLAVVPAVSLLTKKIDKKVVETAFECYNEK
jgi:SSS family solute:Na+ symporter